MRRAPCALHRAQAEALMLVRAGQSSGTERSSASNGRAHDKRLSREAEQTPECRETGFEAKGQTVSQYEHGIDHCMHR